MPVYHPVELALLDAIFGCPHCASFGVTAAMGEHYGVLILHRDVPVGLWSVIGGTLSFRSVANWNVIHIARDMNEAIALTVAMASTNRWQY